MTECAAIAGSAAALEGEPRPIRDTRGRPSTKLFWIGFPGRNIGPNGDL